MKTRIILAFTLLCTMNACIKDNDTVTCTPQGGEIVLDQGGEIILGVNSLPTKTSTRAEGAVEEWDETEVGVAYRFDNMGHTTFARAMTVTMENNDASVLVHTGMEYPADHSAVSFVGFHPAMTPNAGGDVTYDISRGNLDVMRSDKILSGSDTNRISDQLGETLTFRHLLTRVRFIIECAKDPITGEIYTYPEPIFGIRATGTDVTNPLMTLVTLDLDIENSAPVFQLPGAVFVGDTTPFPVPTNGLSNPKTLDMMFQPGAPVNFKVVSMSDEKQIATSTAALWTTLATTGGEQGKVYTIRLQFSSEKIVADDISMTDWVFGPELPNDEGPNTWL